MRCFFMILSYISICCISSDIETYSPGDGLYPFISVMVLGSSILMLDCKLLIFLLVPYIPEIPQIRKSIVIEKESIMCV